MTEYDKVTTWAVTDMLRVYENGKLKCEIPDADWAHLAYALLAGLRKKGRL